ncbi:MAG: gephyrin-like molybdotransferase Glp [Gammaproteobacteria bacterium]|nr:gephyrin-like molybdotransferase Glp [Gammaproteobacteria bacterium]
MTNGLMELDEAVTAMLDALRPVRECETVPLEQARGRITAGALDALQPVPPFANSAMDGYAVVHDDPALLAGDVLQVIDRALAGHPASRHLEPDSCIRIFTGAPVPEGTDAVVAQEDVETLEGDRVRIRQPVEKGRFIRAAGADVAAGDRLVEAGTRLHGGHLGLLAATGHDRVEVLQRPRVTLLTTGDELRDPGESLAPGQIHDASRFSLPALLDALPVRTVAVESVGDDPERLEAALTAAAARSDALICVGGVSVGDADRVRELLEARGAMRFWRLAIKPGKPFAFGDFDALPLFGLPGNPVSSLVTFLLLVRTTPAGELGGVARRPRCAAPGRPPRAAPVRRQGRRAPRLPSARP